MDHTYSRRVDTFDDVSDTEDEPSPPVENVPPIQRPMPRPGQIPLSARMKPLTAPNRAQSPEKQKEKAPAVPDRQQESPRPLHPMEEFNIAEAKRKEEKARAKANESKRQAEKEQEEARKAPKPEVFDPDRLGPPPPDDADLIPLEEKKEEVKVPWPDCIPKVESFAHFRSEKLRGLMEKQDEEEERRAAEGLPPIEFKEPMWNVVPPIEWAYNEKGEKYARLKQLAPPESVLPPPHIVANQYLDPIERLLIVKTGPAKKPPSVQSIPLGQSFNTKSAERQLFQGQRPLTRPSTSGNQNSEKTAFPGQRPLTRPSTSTQKSQSPLANAPTYPIQPFAPELKKDPYVVVHAPEVPKVEQKKSFGVQKPLKAFGFDKPKDQQEQKPLKAFGFDKPKDQQEQKPLKAFGFGNPAEEQQKKSFGVQKPVEEPEDPEPELDEEDPEEEEAPKPPAIQIPRIPQPVEIRESCQCYGCHVEVPHSQLFVCLLASCPYRLKEQHALTVPSQFFGMEKVFCGHCSFMGCHTPHAKHMAEALPLAISTASAETGDHLKREFDDLANLKHEDQVDYVIMGELNAEKLREIPVVEYLSSARNVTEWYARIKQLEDVLVVFKNARHEANGYIADVAERALLYYDKMHKVVLHDLHDRKPKEAQLKAIQLAEHARNLGLPEDYYTKKRNRSSSSSSARSGPAGANPQVMHYVEDQARLLETLDAEIRGNCQDTEQMEKIEKKLHASAVRMLYINMARRYELIQGSMTPEQAILDVSDLLVSKNLEPNVKVEAAKMFNDNMEVQLTWPPIPVNKKEENPEDQETQSEQSTVKAKVSADKKEDADE